MSEQHGFMKALKCRECGREYPLTATHVCEFDFGPLEVAYDYDRIKRSMNKAAIQSRPQSMWRYRELLPVANDPNSQAARTIGQASRTPARARSIAWMGSIPVSCPCAVTIGDTLASPWVAKTEALGGRMRRRA